MEKDKEWLDNYDWWETKNYKVGDITFINNRRNHPHRRIFADWVIENKDINSVLEVGPGEMVEYGLIKDKKPDIDYSIVDVSSMFIENCNKKYPEVNTYRVPLERLDIFDKGQFDCVYQCSVFEHSPDVRKAIKNLMFAGKTFHFVFFKWRYDGNLSVTYVPRKKICSSVFNIWMIIDEIEKYGDIEYSKVVMKDTGEMVQFSDFSKDKVGVWRSGDYLLLHGKQK